MLVAVVLGFCAYWLTLALTPRVLMTLAMGRISASGGGTNHMAHAPLATDTARTVVRPSPDLAYSACPIDLNQGPVRIHAELAGTQTPYWSLSVFDAQTNAVFVRNSRESGGAPIDVVLALPWSKVPAGVPVVRVRDAGAVALVRVLVPDRADFAALDKARRASFCETLGR